MKIGITGSTGFIGSALCERLAVLDFEVVKLVRKASIHGARVVGDIGPDTDWSGALNGCDVVVHLAGRVHVMREAASDPLTLFRKVNTAGTTTLAQAACRSGVKRFIYMSSVKVNGEATSCGHAFTEAANPAPQDAYGISKWEAELSLTSIAHAHGMEWVIIRPPLVYGPGVKANFASLARVVAKGWPLPLGAIRNQRSLVSIDNLVDFVVCCISHPRAANQPFLVSDGQDLSTPELVRKLGSILGRSPWIPSVPVLVLKGLGALSGRLSSVNRLIENLQVDISKARKLLDWVPPFTVTQGLQRVVDAMKKP
ncbi:MAG: SDR family oxidoreductase [Rhodoferax sp.]|nr:SDR family oxidoreductase [Rhodoferax sp.]